MQNLNLEQLYRAMILLLAAKQNGEPVQLNATEAMLVAKVLDSTRPQKLNPERASAIRKEAAKEAAKAVDKTARTNAPGLSRETVLEIRRAVLGVPG